MAGRIRHQAERAGITRLISGLHDVQKRPRFIPDGNKYLPGGRTQVFGRSGNMPNDSGYICPMQKPGIIFLIVRCPAHCEPSRRFFGTGFKHRRYCRARCRIGRKTMRALSRPPASRDSNGLPSLCERPCQGKPPPRRQARSSYRNRIHMSDGPLFQDRPPYLSSAPPHRAPRTEKDILEKRPAVDHLATGLSFRHRPCDRKKAPLFLRSLHWARLFSLR